MTSLPFSLLPDQTPLQPRPNVPQPYEAVAISAGSAPGALVEVSLS